MPPTRIRLGVNLHEGAGSQLSDALPCAGSTLTLATARSVGKVTRPRAVEVKYRTSRAALEAALSEEEMQTSAEILLGWCRVMAYLIEAPDATMWLDICCAYVSAHRYITGRFNQTFLLCNLPSPFSSAW